MVDVVGILRGLSWRNWVGSLSLLVIVVVLSSVVSVPQRWLDWAGDGGSWYALDNYRYPPSASALLMIAGRYTTSGRWIVVADHFTFDLALPIAYASFLAISLSLLVKALFGSRSRALLVAVVPVVGGVFDLLENIGISVICVGYPHDWTIPIARVTGWLTIGKFVGLLASVLCSLCLAFIWSGRAVSRSHKAPA